MKILCLTGTNPYSFIRLVSYVDKNLGPKYDVTIQLGNTDYTPKFSTYFSFCERDNIIKLIKSSDLVITQGGYGSIMDVLNFKKKIIAIPRLIELNESRDNQKELVEYFSEKKFIIPCYNIEKLSHLVSEIFLGKLKVRFYQPDTEIKINQIIEDYLDSELSKIIS